jgi:hypothetical protein
MNDSPSARRSSLPRNKPTLATRTIPLALASGGLHAWEEWRRILLLGDWE